MKQIFESAAVLQRLVPDAVLVGGSAAVLHAGHRESFDHDHVLVDLANRYSVVLEAVEASEGWATSVRQSRPPVTPLGSLDGIEAGLRQLRRARPLETVQVEVAPGETVVVPTLEEALRIKAYLVVQRNAVRDYLDVVALAETMGPHRVVDTLREIDDYYSDRSDQGESVLTQLLLCLAKPSPRDVAVTQELAQYRGLQPRWHNWSQVVATCRDLALGLGGADR
jgi:hypothetical protein